MSILELKLTLFVSLLVLLVCSIGGQRNDSKSTKNASNESKSEIKCNNQTNSRLDSILFKILNKKFPTTPRELRIFCNQGYKGLAYGMRFVKQCLPDFKQKAVSVVLFPIRREINAVCKTGRTGEKAKELMTAAKCGNAARPGLRKCYRNFIKQELIALKVEKKKRIPILCCEFYNIRECFKSEAEEVKLCTPRLIDYMDRWASLLYQDLIDIMCFEYPADSDRCDKVLREMPKLNLTSVLQPKSFLSPLIQIIGDLGDDEVQNLNQ